MHSQEVIERQNRILEIIVSSYVDSAMPVGSRQVSKIIGLSSATVRNVMSDLEEMGYITHPHTSAGRIPTDKGYRRYIESLMRVREVNKQKARRIEEEYHLKRKGIESIIKKTAGLLSAITHHTGVVLFPEVRRSTFKRIELIATGKKRVLVILITVSGVVKNFMLDTKEDLRADLEAISILLNGDHYGLSLEDIKERLIGQIRRERDSSRVVLQEASDLLDAVLDIYQSEELYLEGASHLLSQPEFESPENAKSIMRFFEDKEFLVDLMEKDIQADGIRIYIGKENTSPFMQNCTLVTSGYRVKDEFVGRLGIIGPTRMAYRDLIPMIDYIAETVTRELSDLVE